MSLLIDLTKKMQGKNIDKVSDQIRNQRLSLCNSCPHLVNSTRSCGKFLMGGTVEHEGQKMELCGCNIDDKTKYKYDGCPLGKW